MKLERSIHLLQTTHPLPNKKLGQRGGYRLWAMGKKSSFLLPLASCLLPSVAQGQPIVTGGDGTGTVVTPNGNRFDIQGGKLSGDGANLFHSFQRFGLNAGQIANFLSPQTIRNILARVTGGEPSIINGLIQITGGNPNLFLMNPAGIVFGPNAQLNLPASFLATTSSGIGFGDRWFNAFGPNNYAQLIGTPNAFAFPNQEPAAIANAGHLAVKPGENLTLLGGTVVSVGTLEAPGGTITLVAVPGEKVVRIAQEGRLLSLEVATLTPESGLLTPEARLFKPLSLPEMLTGGGVSQATGVVINAEGEVVLTDGKTASVTAGTAIVAGKVDASSSGESPSLQVGGTVEILGDRIFLNRAKIDVSGPSGGGTVEMMTADSVHPSWGMGSVNIPPPINANEIYVSSDSAIAADAKVSGDGGQVKVGRWGGLTVNEFHGQINARGGNELGNGGTVEVSGGGTFTGSVDLSAVNGNQGTVQLNSENIAVTPLIANSQSPTDSQELKLSQTSLENLTVNADVELQANNNITIQNLSNNQLRFQSKNQVFSGSVTLAADADRSGSGSFAMVNPQNAILTPGGRLTISGQNLTLGKINANGGAINLSANEIQLMGGTSSIGSVGGSIAIAPRMPNQPIEIGGRGTNNPPLDNTLAVTDRDLTALSPGFNSVTIGRSDGTGTITVNAVRVDDPLTIQSPGGKIAVEGEIIGENHASIALNAREVSLKSDITTDRGDINLKSGVTLRNDVLLKAGGGGNIAIAGQVNSEANQVHNLTLTANSGNITYGGAALKNQVNTKTEPTGKTDNGVVNIRIGDTAETQNQGEKIDTNNLKNASVIAPTNYPASLADYNSLTAFNQVMQIEQERSQEFSQNFSGNYSKNSILSGQNIQESLNKIAQKTGKNSAVIYVVSRQNQLELVLVTPSGSPIFRSIPAANQEALQRQVQKLIGGVSHRPDANNSNGYLSAAQQLYQWMVAPLEDELRSRHIDTLAFSLDPGMRSLPLAALHDGQQFLVQKYSLGLIPSINLTDTNYQSINNFSMLAMGAAEFKDPKVVPLPAVPLELSTITQDWQGRSFLNQEFTLENLRKQRTQGQFGIMHLATHGSFDPSTPSNSYIQLWDGQLRFEQLRELGNQRLELLVLSACETAFGSTDAELGFAGLAVQSGVKSVLASLWQVDDAGTLGLMSEFYRQLSLQQVTVKAEALRQAQIAMIEGDLRVEKGQLRSTSRGADGMVLPNTENQNSVNLSHPYYWASFTMIGSPW